MLIPGTIPIFQEITVLDGVVLETLIILMRNPERTNVLCLQLLCRGKFTVTVNSYMSFKGF